MGLRMTLQGDQGTVKYLPSFRQVLRSQLSGRSKIHQGQTKHHIPSWSNELATKGNRCYKNICEYIKKVCPSGTRSTYTEWYNRWVGIGNKTSVPSMS